MEFEEIDRSYAAQFKEELIDSYCMVKEGTGQTVRNYADRGMPDATLEVNLSSDAKGIGFVKVTNNSPSKSMEVVMNFTYSGMKIIKPKSSPYTFKVGPNEYDVVGFFLNTSSNNFTWTDIVTIK